MIRKVKMILLSMVICLLAVTSAWAAKYNEAPMLKVKVAAGELPPVEERLPEEPLVVEPIEEIGEYGGILYQTDPGEQQFEEIVMVQDRIFKIVEGGIAPNIAKGYEFSEGGKVLTIYLRKGMKWSDGAPFSADDFVFWYEDVLQNKDLTTEIPAVWCPGGELMKLEKMNDHTIQLRFVVPYPMLVYTLAHYTGSVTESFSPKHYLEQYHIKYNPKADAVAKEKGFDSWWQLFWEKGDLSPASGVRADPGTPLLNAFTLKKATTSYVEVERNPYYWKVDPAGNQLPYLDGVVARIVADREVYNARIIAGEVDLAGMYTEMANIRLYKEGAEKGNYRVLIWKKPYGSGVIYQVNQTYEKDLVLRKIFRDVRFRRALSLAIDREKINELVYFGMGLPRQMTVVPQSEYFEKEFAEAYAQFDLEKANQLMDEIGLEWDEDHEYRLRSDGERLTITLEFRQKEEGIIRLNELIKEDWKKVGIDLRLKLQAGGIVIQRYSQNEAQMGLWGGDRSAFLFNIDPLWYVPLGYTYAIAWAPLWGKWYATKGKEGEEPPEEVKKNIERWEQFKITLDKEERIRLAKEILRSQAENLWTIGVVGLIPTPVIVKDNLRNVPEEALFGWDYYMTLPWKPSQFFLKSPRYPYQK